MARFKRRKPRVVWLPVHGRDFSDEPEGSNFGNGIGGLDLVPTDGTIFSDIQAVTFDYSDSSSNEEATEFRSLQDLTQGNAYRLRRLVGKFHAAAVLTGSGGTSVPTLDIAAGFIINRTDADGNVLAGPTTISGDVQRGPLAQDGAEDPWIWRRRWILSPIPRIVQYGDNNLIANIQTLAGLTTAQGVFPQTTAEYGSVQDGPHIDQKTARVISTEERLMFWVQARCTNASETHSQVELNWQLDLRILASLRTNIGNRRNASR